MIIKFDPASGSDKADVRVYHEEYVKLLAETDNKPKNSMPIQGTTSCKYMPRNKSFVSCIDLTLDFSSSVSDLHEFCGVLHTNRYDIPDGYNPKLGYKYLILLFYRDELVAIGEKHPKEGEKITLNQYDAGWDMLKPLCLSVHKDAINESNKIY